MATTDAGARSRVPLSKERVLHAAVTLADAAGNAEAVSMRNLAQALGVVPMALYKHVASKDDLLDGMADIIVGEIDPPALDTDWQAVMRQRVLSARNVLLRHPWASRVIEVRAKARANPTPVMMEYLDSMVGLFRAGGFSVDLTHHAMHVMGSRMLGFSQELFEDNGDEAPEQDPVALEGMAKKYPHLAEMAAAIRHDDDTVVGPGCDDQAEFEFALDLVLDGLEQLRARSS